MTITYQVKQSVYVNLTNRCPCACRFCLRNNGSGVFGSGPLWLEREPTLDEVTVSLDGWDYTRFREVVSEFSYSFDNQYCASLLGSENALIL